MENILSKLIYGVFSLQFYIYQQGKLEFEYYVVIFFMYLFI